MMRLILPVLILDHRDKFDRDHRRPLVEQLEHRMLRIGPDSPPTSPERFAFPRAPRPP